MTKQIYIIDAMAWIFRAFYSEDEIHAPDGSPTNASFGFLHFLLRFLYREKPESVAVVFDAGPKCFRNDIYPAYKANRGETPPELLPQFEQCERIVDALGLARFKENNFEADDIIATLATQARAAGVEVTILSGDKDLAQLVDEGTRVLDPSRSKRFTVRTVPKLFGVNPDQMVDYLAMCGDSSDNIPGIPGVGPKTASALLQGLGSMDGIYASLDKVADLPIRGARKLGAKLAEHRELAETCRSLVVLRRDMDLDKNLNDLKWTGARRGETESLFNELGFQHSLSAVPAFAEDD
jgi:DNA polymerase I